MSRRAEWIERVLQVSALDAATALGKQADARRGIYGCPACGAERRHRKSGDRRGAVKPTRNSRGWWCISCDARGNALDFIAFAKGGSRWRELGANAKDDVREWVCSWLRIDVGAVRAPRAARTTKQPAPAPPPHPAPAEPEPEPVPPLEAELQKLWEQQRRVDSDKDVVAYLASRGLSAARIDDWELKLAGLLPRSARAPWSWAGFDRKGKHVPWPAVGLRLLLRRCDAHGQPRTVLFRRVSHTSGEWPPKSMSARGRVGGYTLQCPLARKVLRYAAHPSQWPAQPAADVPFDDAQPWWPADQQLTVIITEGELDFLGWASRAGDADEYAPAVIGVGSGGWTAEYAARIPDDTDILIATDNDAAGDKYAAAIAQTFAGRKVTLRRYRYARAA